MNPVNAYKAWNRLLDSCHVARSTARTQAFEQLVAAYTEPHRHYHNLLHIGHVRWGLHTLSGVLAEPATVELAAWYHDVVYDSSSAENETRSADFARAALAKLGISEERIARVRELILFTRTHQAPDTDADGQLFLDVDLSILGTPWPLYAEYAQAIRREYQQHSDRDYCVGRKQVLEGFLQRARIFRSDVYYQRYDDRARANIAAEIAQIDGTLRTLLP